MIQITVVTCQDGRNGNRCPRVWENLGGPSGVETTDAELNFRELDDVRAAGLSDLLFAFGATLFQVITSYRNLRLLVISGFINSYVGHGRRRTNLECRLLGYESGAHRLKYLIEIFPRNA